MYHQKIEKLHQLLVSRDYKIATAESMTAGLLASTIASVPGASSVLLGGIVCYSTDIKIKTLKVDRELIKKHSAESIEVTRALAENLFSIMKTNVAVAITGVAGSSVNSYQNIASPGEVFIVIGIKREFHEFKLKFSGDRNQIQYMTVDFVLDKLIELLESVPSKKDRDKQILDEFLRILNSTGQKEHYDIIKFEIDRLTKLQNIKRSFEAAGFTELAEKMKNYIDKQFPGHGN